MESYQSLFSKPPLTCNALKCFARFTLKSRLFTSPKCNLANLPFYDPPDARNSLQKLPLFPLCLCFILSLSLWLAALLKFLLSSYISASLLVFLHLSKLSHPFLDTSAHLYKPLCLSVRRPSTVRRFVAISKIEWSKGNLWVLILEIVLWKSCECKNIKKCPKMSKNVQKCPKMS